jgi:hypothetical protein
MLPIPKDRRPRQPVAVSGWLHGAGGVNQVAVASFHQVKVDDGCGAG